MWLSSDPSTYLGLSSLHYSLCCWQGCVTIQHTQCLPEHGYYHTNCIYIIIYFLFMCHAVGLLFFTWIIYVGCLEFSVRHFSVVGLIISVGSFPRSLLEFIYWYLDIRPVTSWRVILRHGWVHMCKKKLTLWYIYLDLPSPSSVIFMLVLVIFSDYCISLILIRIIVYWYMVSWGSLHYHYFSACDSFDWIYLDIYAFLR